MTDARGGQTHERFEAIAGVDTDHFADVFGVEKLGGSAGETRSADALASRTPAPLGRHGRPDDVARVVLFRRSDLAAFVSGATIVVDAADTA